MPQTRRNFLCNASAIPATLAVIGRPSIDIWPQLSDAIKAPSYQVFTAEDLESRLHKLATAPGNEDLASSNQLPMSITLTVERTKTAPEFEYHEHRDHVFQIVDGTTIYELGGTPSNARQVKPGEWLAPRSEGFRRVILKKGDVLMVPHSVPHRRITEQQVSFMLISAAVSS
jgi:mannose-6-phosphate isomerase-like protein (cupin superfamily)